jgi:cytochrome b involved in lipid metabolism
MKKTIIGALAVSFILLGAGCGGAQPSIPASSIDKVSNTPSAVTVPSQPATSDATYTLADVAKHAMQTDCWTAIDGKVYDITQAIDSHPAGAEAIVKGCGIDGTAIFNGIKGGQGHPARAGENLASFLKGTLK